MRAAAARRQASASASSSTRWSLTGGAVGWTMNTSLRRTGSSSRTAISPSGKRSTSQAPSLAPSARATSAASAGLARPVRSTKSRRAAAGALMSGPELAQRGRQRVLDVLDLALADAPGQHAEDGAGDHVGIEVARELLGDPDQEGLRPPLLDRLAGRVPALVVEAADQHGELGAELRDLLDR